MTIVPVGKLVLQVGTGANREEHLHGLVEEMREAVKAVIGRCIEAELEQEVDQALQRKAHRRSKQVSSGVKGKAVCRKCSSHQVNQFWRNGHYLRGLDTSWGHLRIGMPQVRCQCGGGVEIAWQTVRKGQRIWDDLSWELQAEYG